MDVKVCTFSAMASAAMQKGNFALARSKGYAAWSERKQAIIAMLAERDFDFISLQHVSLDWGGKYDSLRQIIFGLAAEGLYYGSLSYVVHPYSSQPELVSLLYKRSRWEIECESAQVIDFESILRESSVPNMSGRAYPRGLFRATQERSSEVRSSQTVYVAAMRLINKPWTSTAKSRVKCLNEIFRDAEKINHGGPALILGDTNITGEVDLDHYYMEGAPVTIDGEVFQKPERVRDAFVEAGIEGQRTQHNYCKPNSYEFRYFRNDRVLYSGAVTLQGTSVIVPGPDEPLLSYHFPVHARFSLMDR